VGGTQPTWKIPGSIVGDRTHKQRQRQGTPQGTRAPPHSRQHGDPCGATHTTTPRGAASSPTTRAGLAVKAVKWPCIGTCAGGGGRGYPGRARSPLQQLRKDQVWKNTGAWQTPSSARHGHTAAEQHKTKVSCSFPETHPTEAAIGPERLQFFVWQNLEAWPGTKEQGQLTYRILRGGGGGTREWVERGCGTCGRYEHHHVPPVAGKHARAGPLPRPGVLSAAATARYAKDRRTHTLERARVPHGNPPYEGCVRNGRCTRAAQPPGNWTIPQKLAPQTKCCWQPMST
jgi:hypothetical protein